MILRVVGLNAIEPLVASVAGFYVDTVQQRLSLRIGRGAELPCDRQVLVQVLL